jgi:tripartite-type tricarboxylate transporter receptor subunit TctC
MKRLFNTVVVGFIAASFVTAPAAVSAKYPNKPITMTITFKPGGAADIAGRLSAKAAERVLGSPIRATNKLGGGGSIGFDFVGKQKPNGYNIGWLSASILTTTLLGKLPYSFEKFDYVCGITFDATTIAVRADAPWKTLPEFLAAAKKSPKKIKIGHAGSGSFTYMTAAALVAKQKVKVTFVPVGKRRLPSLLSGEVHAISVHPPELIPAMKAGKVRLLAVSAPKRVAAYKDVPTFKEIGMDLGFYQFRGVFVPKGTSSRIKAILANSFKAAATDKKLKAMAKKKGFGINYIGLDEFPGYVKKQNALLSKVVAKIKKKKKVKK